MSTSDLGLLYTYVYNNTLYTYVYNKFVLFLRSFYAEIHNFLKRSKLGKNKLLPAMTNLGNGYFLPRGGIIVHICAQ